VDTGGSGDVARRVATARRERWDVVRRVTAAKCERFDAAVSRRVGRVLPPGCRVGGSDGDTASHC
jgi:hypothetical protein